MKDKSKRKDRSRSYDSISDLEEIIKSKEFLEIMKERKNEEFDNQNIPAFHDFLLSHASHRALLFDPLTTTQVMSEIQQNLQANASLSGKSVDEDHFYALAIHRMAPYAQPEIYLSFLSRAVKATKIKREKKLLYWAIADLVSTLGAKRKFDQSLVVRTIVIASVSYALQLTNLVNECVETNPPKGFSYEKILNRTFTIEEWDNHCGLFNVLGPDFAFSVSLRAMETFKQINKPFGFRFYRILHYPSAVKSGPKPKLILLPGEREQPQEGESEEDRFNRLSQAILSDIASRVSLEMIYEVFQSIQKSAAGAVKLPEIAPALNAVAYAFAIPIETNPFLIKLYENSGERAIDINPSDELNFILDIKGSPDNPAFYRKYADHLSGKGELEGALSAYVRASELLPQQDESLNALIKELEDQRNAAKTPKPESSVVMES